MSYAQSRARVLAMLPKGGVGAEIGVWKGDFSAAILAAARPRLLHLIDLWRTARDPLHARAWYGVERGVDLEALHAGVRRRFGAEIAAGRVQVHRAPSAEALAALADGALDFVYVDGDHAYDAVSTDLALAFRKTRRGGLICVDDHRTGKWWGDGVVRAVNELLGAHAQALELEFMAFAQVVIRRR